MKVTKYFQFRRALADRETIQDAWIQEDGRIRLWGKVAQAGNKYLRVVLLEDGETVHNAFFDRKFKE